MSNDAVKIKESCVTRENGVVKLSICVDVTKDISRSDVFFNPRGTWAEDFFKQNHSGEGVTIGSYRAAQSRELRIRSGTDPDSWVLEGEYVFTDRTPAEPKKAAAKKATPKKAAPKKSAPVKAEEPVLVREEVKADAEPEPTKKTAARRTKTTSARKPRAGNTKKRD